MQGGFTESSRQGNERKPIMTVSGEGSKHLHCLQQEAQGRDSVKTDVECELAEAGSDYQEDETTGTTQVPISPPGHWSSEERNSELETLRSIPTTTKPRESRRRNCERKKFTQEQGQESLSGVIACTRITKKTKDLQGWNLDPLETLNRDDNK